MADSKSLTIRSDMSKTCLISDLYLALLGTVTLKWIKCKPRMDKYIHHTLLTEITFPFPNVNAAAVEAW